MNLIDELHRHIAERPNAEAVYVWGDQGRSISFAELGAMVAHYKAILLKHDVKPGDHLAVLISDQLLDLVIYLSLTEIGAGSYIPSSRHDAFHGARSFAIKRMLVLEDDNQLNFKLFGPRSESAAATKRPETPCPGCCAQPPAPPVIPRASSSIIKRQTTAADATLPASISARETGSSPILS